MFAYQSVQRVSLAQLLPAYNLKNSLVLLVAALFLIATFDADARRRALRIEFNDWTNPVFMVPGAECPGTSNLHSRVESPVKASVGLSLPGIEFDSNASDNPLLLNGRYCQEGNPFTGSEFSDEYLNAESFDPTDDPGMRALIGDNQDNAVKGLRYTFLTEPLNPDDTPGPNDAGYQWVFYTFPNNVTLIRFRGDFVDDVDEYAEPIVRSAGDTLFDGFAIINDDLSNIYDGEFFCFRGQEYLGLWDEVTFAGKDPSSGCALPPDETTSTEDVAIPTGRWSGLGIGLGILLLGAISLRHRRQRYYG